MADDFRLHLDAVGHEAVVQVSDILDRGELEPEMEILRPSHFAVGSVLDDDIEAGALQMTARPEGRGGASEMPLEKSGGGGDVGRGKAQMVELHRGGQVGHEIAPEKRGANHRLAHGQRYRRCHAPQTRMAACAEFGGITTGWSSDVCGLLAMPPAICRRGSGTGDV